MKIQYDQEINAVYLQGERKLCIETWASRLDGNPASYAYLTAAQTRRLIAKLEKELAKFPERRSKK